MNMNVGTTERVIRAVIGLILLSLVIIGPHRCRPNSIARDIAYRSF